MLQARRIAGVNGGAPKRRTRRGDGITGLVAVTMFFGLPLAGMYTYYRVRKLRTEEKLAAIARTEPDAWKAVAFGVIPLALGLGFFLDSALVRRDLHA